MKQLMAVLAILLPFLSACQGMPLRGKLINEQSEPIGGATVVLKRTGFTTLSAKDGVFSIENTFFNDTVIITATGYERVEEPSNERGLVTVILKRKAVALAEVTVSTGYQQLPKERATGSFAVVDRGALESRPSSNLLERLDGLAPSLLFDRRKGSGEPLQLRGLSTLRSATAPLIVLDNFPYEGDLSAINPADIESVTLLRDAAAASVWGARAGNGVLVFTTKKGKRYQPLRVSVSSTLTVAERPRITSIPQVSIPGFIALESFLFSKGFYNSELSNTTSRGALSPVVEVLAKQRAGVLSAADAASQIESLGRYDFRSEAKQYLYRAGIAQQHYLSLSGGTRDLTWLFAAGFDGGASTLRGNDNSRLTLRTDNSLSLTKRWDLRWSLTGSWSRAALNSPGGWGAYTVGPRSLYPYARLAGDGGEPLAIDKTYRSGFTDTAGAGRLLDWGYRPLDELALSDHTARSSSLLLALGTSYKLSTALTFDLKWSGQRGASADRNNHVLESYFTRNLVNRFTQLVSGAPKYIVPLGGILDESGTSSWAQYGRAGLTGAWKWGSSSLDLLGGAEASESRSSSASYRTWGYDGDRLTYTSVDAVNTYPVYAGLSGASRLPAFGAFGATVRRTVSLFTNAAYTYRGRYTLSGSLRRDASNLFGVATNQQWTPLGSLGAAWNLAAEGWGFFKPFSVLKLRASWGWSGNVASDLSAYTTISYSDASTANINLPFARIATPGNPSLRWERVGMLNLGLDFRTVGGRFGGSLEWYRKSTADLLGAQTLDPTTGLSTVTANSASLRGSGVDLELTTVNLARAFRWESTLLFSYTGTRVTRYGRDLPDVASSFIGDGAALIPVQGLRPYSIVSFRWAGLDGATGDPQGYLKGAVSKDYAAFFNTPLSDLVISGPGLAPVFGSLRNSFSWKGFSLTASLSYRFGYWFRRSSIDYTAAFAYYNVHPDYDRRWQAPGDEAFTSVPSLVYPANSDRDGFYNNSEVTVEKGDHIRLDWASLTYDWQKRTGKKLPFQSLRFFLTGSNLNLLLWKTNHQGLDPDYPYSLPPSKTLSIGLKTTF